MFIIMKYTMQKIQELQKICYTNIEMIWLSRRNNNSLPTTTWCNYQLFLLYNIHKRITTLSYCMCAILLWIGWWWCYSTWSFHILWDLASARFYRVFFVLNIIEHFQVACKYEHTISVYQYSVSIAIMSRHILFNIDSNEWGLICLCFKNSR